MKKITMLLLAGLVTATLAGCAVQQADSGTTLALPHEVHDMRDKVTKTDSEWKAAMTAQEYDVMRQKGTEPAFTGKYWNDHTRGIYLCAACGNPLFSSDTKYNSGTGWPSFWQPLFPDSVKFVDDDSLGMRRVEVECARCGAHLGHIFDDGPKPTGKRFCMNSVSLKLDPGAVVAPDPKK